LAVPSKLVLRGDRLGDARKIEEDIEDIGWTIDIDGGVIGLGGDTGHVSEDGTEVESARTDDDHPMELDAPGFGKSPVMRSEKKVITRSKDHIPVGSEW